MKRLEQGALDAPQYYPKAQIRQGADRSAEHERQSSPPAHRGARVIRTDAFRFVLILREPRDGQERKQDSEDDPDINAHQSSGSYPPINRSKRKPRASGALRVPARSLVLTRRPDIIPRRETRYHPKA